MLWCYLEFAFFSFRWKARLGLDTRPLVYVLGGQSRLMLGLKGDSWAFQGKKLVSAGWG